MSSIVEPKPADQQPAESPRAKESAEGADVVAAPLVEAKSAEQQPEEPTQAKESADGAGAAEAEPAKQQPTEQPTEQPPADGADEQQGDEWPEEPPPKRRRTLKEAEDERGQCTVIVMPSEAAEALKSKLQELCSAHGVEAEFEEDGDYTDEHALISVSVGDEVEVAKDGDWCVGTVTAYVSGTNFKVKFGEDQPEVDFPWASLRKPVPKKMEVDEKENENNTNAEMEDVGETAVEQDDTFKLNDKVEAKFGTDDWRIAIVVSEDCSGESIKIKWEFDGSEEEVVAVDVRRPVVVPEEPAPVVPEIAFKIGLEVEAKFGDDWHKAVVLGIGESTVRIRWGFDESEERVEKTNVREIEPEQPPPPMVFVKLIIFGGTARGRMQMELEVMQIVDKKVPDFFKEHPRKAEELDEGLGWSVVALLNEGEFKPKIVGKKGAMKLKITKACGSALGVAGTDAHIVGTLEERTRTESILDIIQRTGKGEDVKEIPEAVRPLCRVIRVPTLAMAELLKDARAAINSIEETTGVMTFLLSASASVAREALGKNTSTSDYTKDMEVEGSVGGMWQKGKVVEQFVDDDDDVMIRIKWDSDGKEIDLPPSRVRSFDGANKCRDLLAKARPMALIALTDHARRVAELRILDVVEGTADKGFAKEVLLGAAATSSDDSTGISSMELSAEDVEKYKQDASASKVRAGSKASRSIIGVVGESLYFIGTEEQRKAAKEFMQWWLKGSELEVDHRDDVEKLFVLKEKVSNLNEAVVSKVEEETCTFVLWDDGAALAGIEDSARALVCGLHQDDRKAAVAKLTVLQDVVPEPAWGESTSWEKTDDDKKEDDGAENNDNDKKEETSWDAKPEDSWNKSAETWAEEKDSSKNEKSQDWEASKTEWDEKKDTKGWGDKAGAKKMCNDYKAGKCHRATCKFSHDDTDAEAGNSSGDSSKKEEWDTKKDSWDEKPADAWADNSGKKDWNTKKDDWGESKKQEEWGESKKDAWGDSKKKDEWADSKKKEDWADSKKKDEWGESKKDEWGASKKEEWGESKKDEWGDGKKDEWGENKKEEWGDKGGDKGGQGKKVCFDFQKGKCTRATCKFAHEGGESAGDDQKPADAWEADEKWGSGETSKKQDEWATSSSKSDGGWGTSKEGSDDWADAPEAKRPRYDAPSSRQAAIGIAEKPRPTTSKRPPWAP